MQPLSEESRKRYEERWLGVERTFVDDPWASLEGADRVVADILAERNFPTDSRQEASRGVGVMHPQVVEDFREAQRVHRDATDSEGEAEMHEHLDHSASSSLLATTAVTRELYPQTSRERIMGSESHDHARLLRCSRVSRMRAAAGLEIGLEILRGSRGIAVGCNFMDGEVQITLSAGRGGG